MREAREQGSGRSGTSHQPLLQAAVCAGEDGIQKMQDRFVELPWEWSEDNALQLLRYPFTRRRLCGIRGKSGFALAGGFDFNDPEDVTQAVQPRIRLVNEDLPN